MPTAEIVKKFGSSRLYIYDAEAGFGVDDIAITGLTTDDAETDPG